jgi:hypothetical protein
MEEESPRSDERLDAASPGERTDTSDPDPQVLVEPQQPTDADPRLEYRLQMSEEREETWTIVYEAEEGEADA